MNKRLIAVALFFASTFAFAQNPPAPVAADPAASAQQVQGNVASGQPDVGNPFKFGCVYNTTLPIYLNLQRTDCQSDASGNVRVRMFGQQNTAIDGVANTNLVSVGAVVDLGAATTLRPLTTAPWFFGGTTWERSYTCNSSAVINVTAGSTTEIVALSGAQTIRVCSFSVAMSAAGTAQFVYGTGTNCGTGTVSITGAMPLATGTPWGLASGTGNVFRALTSNALCVAAVTGNVVGYLQFSKF